MCKDSLLTVFDLKKHYPGVKALDGVNFELTSGEIHVLVGENGAGKSTFVKILCGAITKDSGRLYLENKEVDFKNVQQAFSAGVSVIYQELNLISDLTIAENIFLGREPTVRANQIVDISTMNERAKNILRNLELDISPKEKIRRLGIAEKQMVEIARAISQKTKILIMDEPTSAITEKERDVLFKTIHKLKNQGVGILYISHKLKELDYIGDRITVFRNGKHIITETIGNISIDQIVEAMTGREISERYPKVEVEIGEEVLRVEKLSTKSKLKDCSLVVRKGEIVALVGLMGSGRTEMARAIIGADKKVSGNIYIHGKLVKINHPKKAIRNGISYLPEDRQLQSLIKIQNIKLNITIGNLDKIKSLVGLDLMKEEKLVKDLVHQLDIRTPGVRQRVDYLSGGNQQKVVLGRCLFNESKILIVDEPTRGIDVGAKVEIYKILGELLKDGKTIILISSELHEVISISDTIVVMRDGAIVANLKTSNTTIDEIMKYALAVNKSN